MSQVNLEKAAVGRFLDALDVHLRARLKLAVRERGGSISQQVSDMRRRAAESKDRSTAHLKQPEAAFLNMWVAPAINATLRASGLSPDQARDLLFAESYEALKEISRGPAARPVAFPFEKRLGVSAGETYQRWAGRTKSRPFMQPYPDLAVGAPYAVVVEGKYFRSGSPEYAERQLVTAIHEALFYLGVPDVEEGGRVWSYRYACLVAFDASPEGHLLAAWKALRTLHGEFWRAANLRVILVGDREVTG